MRRLLTSTPVAAAALFAATWIVSEPIAGLSGPISLALSGVVTVSVVPWLLFRTRRTQIVVQPYRRDVRSGWTGVHDAQPSAADATIRAPTRHPGTARTPQGPQRLVTQYVRIVLDDAGFEVEKKRKTAVADAWDEYLRMEWSKVAAMRFATARHDPVVALYAWTAFGERHHVADSRLLSGSEWAQLSKLIAESTGSRLALDLTERGNPPVLPDS
jgi:hypothetical protein